MSRALEIAAVALIALLSVADRSAIGQVFEVASVKPAPHANATRAVMMGGPRSGSPGQFTCLSITLTPLLLRAYGLRSYQLAGPPSLDRETWDIAAKIPAGADERDFDLMLRDLLAERFGVTAHRETRSLPTYRLLVAKGGVKMKAAEAAPFASPADLAPGPPVAERPPTGAQKRNGGFSDLPPGEPAIIVRSRSGVTRVSARMQTVPSLLRGMEYQIGRPVVDETGLAAAYDFDLVYAEDNPPPAQPAGWRSSSESSFGKIAEPADASDAIPALFSAFEGQLGLRLVPARGPVEVLVVDHVNQTPTAN